MFKKIKFNREEKMMKLLLFENVEINGYGKDFSGNKVIVYEDYLGNLYYSYENSIKDIFKAVVEYIENNNDLYSLLQLRGMVLTLNLIDVENQLNNSKIINKLTKKINDIKDINYREIICKEINENPFKELNPSDLFSYEAALKILLNRMEILYNA